MSPTDIFELEFASPDSGEASLTWGQLAIWRPLQAMPENAGYFNLKRTLHLARGVDRRLAEAALHELVLRNQVLRLHFLDGPPPRQRVETRGTHRVGIFDTDAYSIQEMAERVTDWMASLGFDLQAEWPVRFSFVRVDGLVCAIGIVASHVGVDGYAFELLIGQLRELLSGGGCEKRVAWQPLDQAAYEASAPARRRSERSLEHWRVRLPVAPSRPTHPVVPAAGTLPIRLWRFHSEALVRSASSVARMTRTSTSTVLLTVSALILRALSAEKATVLKLIASNRYAQPEIKELVAPTCQDALFVCRADGGDLLSAIGSCFRDATESYFNAFYDPDGMAELVAGAGRERGSELDLSAYFNDARLAREWSGAAFEHVSREQIAKTRARSELVPTGALATHDMTFCVIASHFGGRGGISLLADARRVPLEVCERVPAGIEAVLCEALFRRVKLDEVPEVAGIAA